jgi:hypothetical protein
MQGIYRKSDGAYVDNEQSWVVLPDDLAAAAAAKHGGGASDYVVKDTLKPWMRKLSGSKLVDDKAKLSALKERDAAEQKVSAARKRIEKRRLEAELSLAEGAGDGDAAAVLGEELSSLG